MYKSSSVIDPMFELFFGPAKYFYWYMPLNPYRLFLGPVSTREFIFGRFCYFFVMSSQLLLMILYALFLVRAINNGEDTLIIADTLVWLIIDVNALLFLIFSWNSGKDIAALLQQLHNIFPSAEDVIERGNAIRCAQEWTSKMNIHTALFNTALFGMVLMPIIWSVVGYYQTGFWNNYLPMNLWFPIDVLVMPVYPLVYVLEIWLFVASTYIILAPVKVLGAITMLTCLELKSVADRFRYIPYSNHCNDLLSLADAIRRHNRALEIASKIRTVFSVPILIIFALSSIIICLYMFLLINWGNSFAIFQYTANLAAFLLFCWFNSYIGNEIIQHVSSI